jgi:hypothetical protein
VNFAELSFLNLNSSCVTFRDVFAHTYR